MVIIGLFSWWYGAGWLNQVSLVRDRLARLYDYFSFDILARTLFAPFRQISAGSVRGSLVVQMRAWFDKLFSRLVGSVVRTIVMMIGLVAMTIAVVVGLIAVIVWPLVPLLPVVGLIFSFIGWTPWRI